MNRVKITLAVGILLAMAFTFNNCSSDDGGGGGKETVACKTTKPNGEVNCQEGPKDMLINKYGSLDKLKSDCEEEDSGEFLNSCPSGYTFKCKVREDKTVYRYSEEYKSMTCEEYIKGL
jgi:hypothetical protein